jgi:hypothetical protein
MLPIPYMTVHPFHEPAPPDNVEDNYLGLQEQTSEHPQRIGIAMAGRVSHSPIVVTVILDDEVVEVVDGELQDDDTTGPSQLLEHTPFDNRSHQTNIQYANSILVMTIDVLAQSPVEDHHLPILERYLWSLEPRFSADLPH